MYFFGIWFILYFNNFTIETSNSGRIVSSSERSYAFICVLLTALPTRGKDKIKLTNLLSLYLWIIVASVGLLSSCCLRFQLVGILSS